MITACIDCFGDLLCEACHGTRVVGLINGQPAWKHAKEVQLRAQLEQVNADSSTPVEPTPTTSK